MKSTKKTMSVEWQWEKLNTGFIIYNVQRRKECESTS